MILTKKNILLCSNDIGSTHQYIYLYKLLKHIYDFKATGSKIALKEYKKNKIKTLDKKYFERKHLKKNLVKLNLSFIFLGLSLQTKNFEKKLLNVSKVFKIKTGVIQDYWGYNGVFNNINSPDYFWFVDDYSIKLSKKKLNLKQKFIIGHFKYNFHKINLAYKNIRIKNKLLIIGQPIIFPGIKTYLRNTIDLLKDLKSNFECIYIPHPSDINNLKYFRKISNQKNFSSYKVMQINDKLLLETKLIITSYSTVGMDFIFLKYLYSRNDGQIFYFTPKLMINSLRKIIGTAQIPPVKFRLAEQFYTKNDLQKGINKILNFDPSFNKNLTNSKIYFAKYLKNYKRLEYQLSKII